MCPYWELTRQKESIMEDRSLAVEGTFLSISIGEKELLKKSSTVSKLLDRGGGA